LKAIIEEQKRRELDMLMSHLKRIENVGVQNAAVLDSIDGTIVGPGGKILIDENLLSNINFLREGTFREKEGTPAVRIVGEAEVVRSDKIQPVRKVYVPRAIRTTDLVHGFLDQKELEDPEAYLKQLCFETSGYLPMYYFIKKAGLTVSAAREMLAGVQSAFTSKRTIMKRLRSDKDFSVRRDVSSKTSKEKNQFRKRYLRKEVDTNIEVGKIKYALGGVRTMSRNEVDPTYIFPIIREWFDSYYADRGVGLAGDLRDAICYLDMILYKDAVAK
jgi:hypothetical protein